MKKEKRTVLKRGCVISATVLVLATVCAAFFAYVSDYYPADDTAISAEEQLEQTLEAIKAFMAEDKRKE